MYLYTLLAVHISSMLDNLTWHYKYCEYLATRKTLVSLYVAGTLSNDDLSSLEAQWSFNPERGDGVICGIDLAVRRHRLRGSSRIHTTVVRQTAFTSANSSTMRVDVVTCIAGR